MDIQDEDLYILVEGEPTSPEVKAFRKLLPLDNTVTYQFVEIGGSGNFNAVAKLIYNKVKNREESSIHKVIPVLAIADRDFRKYSSGDNVQDSLLIEKNRAKVIYWERHEWENFLLDELDVIISYLNQLPIESLKNRPAKKVPNQITEELINNFLLEYFQNQIQAEFIECIRFRFSDLSKSYPKLKAPKDIIGIESLREWYRLQIAEQSQQSKHKIESYATIFDQVLEEYDWGSWIEDPLSLSLEDGKKYLRGKEAFTSLFNYLCQEFEIINLNEDKLKERILKDLENKQESVLVAQINKLLLPYLEKAKEVLE
ncbi:hypothetical protein H6F44_01520 [Pseudanabaena sp. FACHB-1277]|uniref:Uncharacterized protein n=1 Tax=Pseudanabaena cinerea FACHB-1277 TaxID=2949581 RepID=A0A926UPE1_9CYAN|nr:hypothetical protein [Pseudanabaena cinerea]MBD2148811.1 hypothetical protein [Pseudanabaena cinerea FACHB-1277]